LSAGAELVVRQLGQVDYVRCWQAMKQFTDSRDGETVDEIWLLEHPPVFTQGQAGKAEHILAPGDIPVVQVDRGGQVTYHGPGQLVVYLMLDLRRLGLGVRQLVDIIEQSIIDLLDRYGVRAVARADAPGVYIAGQDNIAGGEQRMPDHRVNGAKIAALGLRVRKGCTFHGLALNLDLDLTPFVGINPCGYAGQNVVRLKDLVAHWAADERQRVEQSLVHHLAGRLGYVHWRQMSGLPAGDDSSEEQDDKQAT
jgi:lipoyl(octanoyl) transferase